MINVNELVNGTQYNEGGMWSPGSFQTLKNKAYIDVVEVSLYGREKDRNYTTTGTEIKAVWDNVSDQAFSNPSRKAYWVLEHILNNK